MSDIPHEPQEFIDNLVEDIEEHAPNSRLLLNIGAGDCYETENVNASIPTLIVYSVDGDSQLPWVKPFVISQITGPTEFFAFQQPPRS